MYGLSKDLCNGHFFHYHLLPSPNLSASLYFHHFHTLWVLPESWNSSAVGVQVWALGSIRSSCMRHVGKRAMSNECKVGCARALISFLTCWWGHLALWTATRSFRRWVPASNGGGVVQGRPPWCDRACSRQQTLRVSFSYSPREPLTYLIP